MDNCRCFFSGCSNQPKGYCKCTEIDVYMCLDHQFEHFKKQSDEGHNWIDLETIKKIDLLAQKLSECLNELYISKQNAIKEAADISNSLMKSLSLLLDRMTRTIETIQMKIIELTNAKFDLKEVVSENELYNLIQAFKISKNNQKLALETQITAYFKWPVSDKKSKASKLIPKGLIQDLFINEASDPVKRDITHSFPSLSEVTTKFQKDVDDPDSLECKIIIVGDPNVGKSLIFAQMHRDLKLPAKAWITGVVNFTKPVCLQSGKMVNLEVWDTEGQERFLSILMSQYKNAIGGLIVYDITSAQSFSNAKRWIDAFKTHEDPYKPVTMMLIGTKIDLTSWNVERKVTTESGMQFARNNGLLFAEISAYDADKVQQSFNILIEEIFNK